MTGTQELADQVARTVSERGLTLAVAESLTSGHLAAALGAAPEASTWFRGGVVAYASEVKYDLLGVPKGPVVTQEAARAMAEGVCRVLGSDVASSVTGVGGPGEEEGLAPGSVWLATSGPEGVTCAFFQFDGGPAEVIEQTTEQALRMLLTAVQGGE
jgi:nicotinamide-nucleotide amidase